MCREVAQSKPARSRPASFSQRGCLEGKIIVQIPAEKTCNCQRNEVGGQEGLLNLGPGELLAGGAKPCGASAQGNFRGPGRAARPGTPRPRGPSPAPDTAADATRVVTGLHSWQRDSPRGLCEGLGHGEGSGGGRPLPQHRVRRKPTGTGERGDPQLATPRRSGGASHCLPGKGAKFPRAPSALHRARRRSTARPAPEPHGAMGPGEHGPAPAPAPAPSLLSRRFSKVLTKVIGSKTATRTACCPPTVCRSGRAQARTGSAQGGPRAHPGEGGGRDTPTLVAL